MGSPQGRRVRVRNLTRDTIVAEAAEVADTSAQRRRGLLGRTGLESGGGLWIVPCESVHMFFMKFAIDLIYLDRQKNVRKVLRNLRPWRVSACPSAHSVLELPVGTISTSGTEKGDQFTLEEA